VEVGWEPPRGPGVRLASRLGVSLLSTEPASGFAASPTAVRTAAFLELDVQRPIWFGAIGVAPGVGVRVFSAPRTVNVDGEQALRLAAPTPRVTVALLLQTN
ncbi:MAG TPA: hypothetical protein VFQ35_14830, partial [Polyangiaceae bacterium]|nr:hypothetical protein [Polyangiaceae bacterium]